MSQLAEQPRDTAGRFGEKSHGAPEAGLADARVQDLVATVRDVIDGSAPGYGLTLADAELDAALAELERALWEAAR